MVTITKANFVTESGTERVKESIKTAALTLASTSLINPVVKAYTHGKMENDTKASGLMDSLREEGSRSCLMAQSMMVCGRRVCPRETAFASTLITVSTMVIGQKDSHTARVRKLCLMAQHSMVAGLKAKQEVTESRFYQMVQFSRVNGTRVDF